MHLPLFASSGGGLIIILDVHVFERMTQVAITGLFPVRVKALTVVAFYRPLVLGEDMLDVDFCGAHTHRQVAGDLAVGLPLHEQVQPFTLAWGQRY